MNTPDNEPHHSTNGSSTLSRRDFLKATAAVSAAGLMANLGTNYAHAQGADRLRVGLIGCGGRGTGAAGDCAHAHPSVQIVAMGDMFKDRLDSSRASLKALGDQFKVTDDHCFVGFDAYQKVIDSGVDLVLLATPPAFRPMHLQAAIAAGKHVFAEKPVAVDATGVRSFIATSELAAQKNLAIVAGTIYRRYASFVEVVNRVHAGAIGNIVSAHCYFNVGGLWMHPRQPGWSDMEWQLRDWYYFTWLSGDHIVEQFVHNLDTMNWVMQAHPVSAYGMGGRQVRTDPAFGHIYDHFTIEYEYPNGARLTAMCRQQDGTDSRVTNTVFGTQGVANTQSLGNTGSTIKGEHPYRFDGEAPNPYVQEHIDLINSIRNGKPLNEGHQVAESTLTAIMGRESAYTGKTVSWDQAINSKLDLMPKKLEFGPLPTPPVAIPGKTPLV
ncbi:MAG: Gfo/Idh/MocA family oxidoreductase [Abitibacteriaceae bacterium]|nr:Gfo/Idh/MocA family oxidoreductase [Abditibacteriaceae bacterium]MBV9865878.1 Gfo/Idh/MocA family oxidoreductase [Abditibacteriaceae bacterium]